MATNISDKLITLGGLKAALESLDLGSDSPSSDGTIKTRIDFDGSKFRVNGEILNYKQLYETHITKPDFAFVVYGDRAYLLSYVQDGTGMKEMRFQSVLATTDSDNLSYVKTSGIYVTSSDGVNIASVKITDVNSENKSYKADSITEANKNSKVWYPSTKAVVDYVNEQNGNKVEQADLEFYATKEDLSDKLDKETADTLYAPIGSTGGSGTGIKGLADLCLALKGARYDTLESAQAAQRFVEANEGGGSDTPSEPDEPTAPTLTGITVTWSAESADVGTNPKTLISSVKANYSDGTSQTVTGYTVTPTTIAEGVNNVTVSYSGKVATKTITGIAIVPDVPAEPKWVDVEMTQDYSYVTNNLYVGDDTSTPLTEFVNGTSNTTKYSTEAFAKDGVVEVSVNCISTNTGGITAKLFMGQVIEPVFSNSKTNDVFNTFYLNYANYGLRRNDRIYPEESFTQTYNVKAGKNLLFAVFNASSLKDNFEVSVKFKEVI